MARSTAAGAAILAGLAVLQSTVLSQFTILDGRPDLVLLAVMGWAVAGRPEEAMVWGLIGGCFLDLYSGIPFASTSIVLVLLAYLVSFLGSRFWQAHFFLPLGVVLAASFVLHAWGIGLLLILGREIDLSQALTRVVLPSTFLNLALALPAAQAAAGLSRTLHPPEVSF
ncbi:MAG TPA: rod shape-determining protein MreD [Anaerolineales bacterium]